MPDATTIAAPRKAAITLVRFKIRRPVSSLWFAFALLMSRETADDLSKLFLLPDLCLERATISTYPCVNRQLRIINVPGGSK
jgi:hypothetical protein